MIHKDLSNGRWFNLTVPEQLANIGSEIERTMSWRSKNKDYSEKAFYRALELLELTILDPKNRRRLKEFTRLKETLADYFAFDNSYQSSDELWHKYFFPFNWAARLGPPTPPY